MEILLGIQFKGAIIVKLRVNLSYITLMQTETSWSVVKISFFLLWTTTSAKVLFYTHALEEVAWK